MNVPFSPNYLFYLHHLWGFLSQNSQQIHSVLDVITALADQTNLLVLNAAIEAEKQGEVLPS